jgi:hypothetical protein
LWRIIDADARDHERRTGQRDAVDPGLESFDVPEHVACQVSSNLPYDK